MATKILKLSIKGRVTPIEIEVHDNKDTRPNVNEKHLALTLDDNSVWYAGLITPTNEGFLSRNTYIDINGYTLASSIGGLYEYSVPAQLEMKLSDAGILTWNRVSILGDPITKYKITIGSYSTIQTITGAAGTYDASAYTSRGAYSVSLAPLVGDSPYETVTISGFTPYWTSKTFATTEQGTTTIARIVGANRTLRKCKLMCILISGGGGGGGAGAGHYGFPGSYYGGSGGMGCVSFIEKSAFTVPDNISSFTLTGGVKGLGGAGGASRSAQAPSGTNGGVTTMIWKTASGGSGSVKSEEGRGGGGGKGKSPGTDYYPRSKSFGRHGKTIYVHGGLGGRKSYNSPGYSGEDGWTGKGIVYFECEYLVDS